MLALLQNNCNPVENEDDDFSDVDADDDDASQVGGKSGWSLSSIEMTTKQISAERHYEGEPS